MTLAERLMAEAASFQTSVAGEGAEPAAGGAATSGGDHATDGEARSSSARSSHGVQGQAEGDGPGPGGRELGGESGAPAAGAGAGGEHTGRAGLDSISCRTVDNYEKDKKMGEGQYGAVYRAKDRSTGEVVALKKVFMEREREGFPMTSLREMNILMAIDHPYIVGVKEICVSETDFNSIFMVMELIEHDLKSVLDRQKQPFSQAECKTLMLQLLSGVEHLHDNWVLHRDLKPSNLLYGNGILKICDFGLARAYGSPLKDLTTPVVTLYYRSTELLLGAKQYSTPADMWSVGAIFGEMLLRKPLIMGKNELDQLDQICKLLGAPDPDDWPEMLALPDAALLGRGRNAKARKSRLPDHFEVGAQSWKAAADKPALAESGLHLMASLLTHRPDKRMTAAAALQHQWFKESPQPQNTDWMPTYPRGG